MTLGSLVPVDRGNRDAGISAVRDAVKAIEQGLNMSIYVEGHRSFDGKLLPFKKGPSILPRSAKFRSFRLRFPAPKPACRKRALRFDRE